MTNVLNCYVIYVWRFPWSCLGVCDRCMFCHLLILSALSVLVVLLVVHVLLARFDGCRCYVLCNICVLVIVVMS